MVEINKELVQQLIDQQFPQWSGLLISPVEKSGHDNRTFHLGDKRTVRLPSGPEYAPQVVKELAWLPKLQPFLSLPISTPLAKGESTKDYPFPWSINLWIEGDTVNYNRVTDLNQLAVDLAALLKELQSIDTSGGPVAGEHNFYRGGLLSVYHHETQTALEELKSELPTDKINDIWSLALESKWQSTPVWVHGDIAPGNLLVKNGKLCGVIDFGILGMGDPACDYAMAWTFFDQDSRRTFYNSLGCDEDTWNRARGWALWKALITYNDTDCEIATSAKKTIGAILEECKLTDI
ncbi:aminoglycoside phosphotransferase family protein [Paenibacillus segetis]|uniref:Acetyltransferase n=1 Tax=Paenibacillus segetis TaxID=1325360 RepID=A0ABQ1YFM8_9BACL|nr:aminoglycoside phosphotransferase family protein [Paenibacillus segetis]GGH23554.1 acetyltransferase [Paenibacillus segetis]